MAPPTVDVKVACEALRSDAKKWETASDEMSYSAMAARNLELNEHQFGHFVATHGLVTSYAALQQRLANLLDGADTELGKIARTLRMVADTYEREDAAGAHKFKKAGN
jgi:hypothetical protein